MGKLFKSLLCTVISNRKYIKVIFSKILTLLKSNCTIPVWKIIGRSVLLCFWYLFCENIYKKIFFLRIYMTDWSNITDHYWNLDQTFVCWNRHFCDANTVKIDQIDHQMLLYLFCAIKFHKINIFFLICQNTINSWFSIMSFYF